MNIQDELDHLFTTEPPLPAPEQRLYAGRAALRRRRMLGGVGVAAAAVVLGGTGWALASSPDDASRDRDALYATDPTSTPDSPDRPVELPLAPPDDCLTGLCVFELVPRGEQELNLPETGTMLGYRHGRLVRFHEGFEVTTRIQDPAGTGASLSDAVEVSYRGARFRVAMAAEFGYYADQVRDGDSRSLQEWFDAQHALPTNNCPVIVGGTNPDRADLPGPNECWLEVDSDGEVVGAEGVTITRTVPGRDLPTKVAPVGSTLQGFEFTRNGQQWLGIVRMIGKGSFVTTQLMRVGPRHETRTIDQWLETVATNPDELNGESGILDSPERREHEPEARR